MSDRDPQTDGGVTKEDIFGTGEESERARTPPGERLQTLFDTYVRTPLLIGWSDWRTRIGGVGVLFYILMGTVGVMIVPEPQLNEGPRYLGAFENMALPLGTDNVGRSIGKQIVHATPAMLKMALAGVVFTIGVASIVGFVSGYKGGVLDTAMMTITDIVIMLPGLPLIMIIAAIFGPEDPFLVGAIIAIDSWPGLARAIRSQVLTLRQEEYVEAARTMGLSQSKIIGQELMPKLAPYILINAAGAATAVIGASVALYFLNILPFSEENWGVMMYFAYNQGNAVSNPDLAGHWLFFPLIALSGLLFMLVLFSQGLDRVFNPRLRARHSNTVPTDEADEDSEVL